MIVVDDGITTGFTTMVAVQYIRELKPKKLILAVAVSASDSYNKLKKEVDEFICPEIRDDFFAVGQFYEEFNQVEDGKAKILLDFQKNSA